MEILSLDEIEEQEKIWSNFSYKAHEKSKGWFDEIKKFYLEKIETKLKEAVEKYNLSRNIRQPFTERQKLIDRTFLLEEMRLELEKRKFQEYLNPEDLSEIKRKGLKKYYQDIFLFI